MNNHIGIREIGSIQGDISEATGSITSRCWTCRWENSRRRYDMDGWHRCTGRSSTGIFRRSQWSSDTADDAVQWVYAWIWLKRMRERSER